MNERIKIFLNNSFKYSGIRQEAEQGFVTILDDKDGKKISFPISSILSMETIR